MQPSATLFIVEDDPHTRLSLVKALGHRTGRFSLLGASGRAESALVAVDCAQVDLIVADYALEGDVDGVGLATLVKQRSPATRLLLVTGFFDPAITRRALAAGADGVLHKPFDLPALQSCARTVLAGHRVLSERATGQLLAGPPVVVALPPPDRLTLREREVLRAFASGLLVKQVAGLLQISETTVKTHKEHIVAKLGVLNITQAVSRYAGHAG